MIYKVFRPLLFALPPETAHRVTTAAFQIMCAVPGVSLLCSSYFTVKNKLLNRRVFGIDFPNPVGLAAGFDKEGTLYKSFRHLGFGFIEIGTVTPQGQPGNPKPRMFRLPQDQGLINRMGFNNQGLEKAVEKLKNKPKNLIIGGNIGKNKDTPNNEAVNDYIICFEGLFDYVDYFVVNVSSPNTPGLRELQDKKPLLHILSTLQKKNATKPTRKPILLKIAPDLTDTQLDEIMEIVEETKIDGLIATNTTIERDGLQSPKAVTAQSGGLSGVPVKEKSTQVIKYLHKKSGGKLPIIGVGGINDYASAKEKLNAGASLIQIYTGLIYEGPALIKTINKKLAADAKHQNLD